MIAISPEEAYPPMQLPNKLSGTTLELVESAFPASAKDISRLIGIQATLALVREFGGSEISFPKNQEGKAPERFAFLANIIGATNVRILANADRGCEEVYVPRCAKALRLIRDREIVAEYEKLLKTNSAAGAAQIIAKKQRMTQRNVNLIVNRPCN